MQVLKNGPEPENGGALEEEKTANSCINRDTEVSPLMHARSIENGKSEKTENSTYGGLLLFCLCDLFNAHQYISPLTNP